MSEIYIHYGNLEDSVKKSQKVRGEIYGYVEEIKKRITTPISGLSGSDSAGYASTASSLAWQKITSLNNKANRFSAYESTVNTLISTAKTKDNYVSDQIETIAGMYVEKRKWYQKAGDWIYNTFCVDLANTWGWTRGWADASKWVRNKIGNTFEHIVDWFKYGNGKYVWQIGSAVLGTIVAIGGAIAAVAAIPFSAGATIPIVIGCVAAAAASVSAIITTFNSVTSVVQNSRALAKAREGDPSAARYYGSQNKLSDYFNKTDMGGKQANKFWEGTGKVVDTTKVVADVTSFVCSIANLGVVRDYRVKTRSDINTRVNAGKWNEGYQFSFKDKKATKATLENIRKNILHDMGYKTSVKKLDYEKGFGVKKSILAENWDTKKFTIDWKAYTLKIKGVKIFSVKDTNWTMAEGTVKFFKNAKAVKNIKDVGENIYDMADYFKYRDTAPTFDDSADAVKAFTGLLKHMKFTAIYDDYGTSTAEAFENVVKLFAS